jgi:NAD(P)H-flavin reductase
MTVKETRATIERVRRLSAQIQRIDLGVEESLARIKPGQLMLARLSDESWDPYLAEQWMPVMLNGRTVTIERPARNHYTPGQVVTLMGPVGAPFPMRYNLRSLLLLALDTPPTPLLLLATLALRTKIEVTLVVSGEAQSYPLDALPPEVEVLHGDLENGWPNEVTTVGWADQVIAVADPRYRHQIYPALLEKIHHLRAEVPTRYVLGIFDVPMPCGTGACQGCTIPMRGGKDWRVCVDGPAVDLEDVKFS